jgi:hypothetical protein
VVPKIQPDGSMASGGLGCEHGLAVRPPAQDCVLRVDVAWERDAGSLLRHVVRDATPNAASSILRAIRSIRAAVCSRTLRSELSAHAARYGIE